MNRKIWSEDQKEILELVDILVESKLLVTLQATGKLRLKTRVVGIRNHNNIPYLVMHRPPDLQDSLIVRDMFFKMKGMPILGFSCPITREGESVIATMLPAQVFKIDLREGGDRFEPLDGSMVTFFVRDKTRASICRMADISLGGALLVGAPTQPVRVNDIIGPCTLSLAGIDSLISSEITVQKAIIVRAVENAGKDRQFGLGIQFELDDEEEELLREQLEKLKEQTVDED